MTEIATWTTRSRSALALQANRYLARFVVARPVATGEEPEGADGVLLQTLQAERDLSPTFQALTDAIDAASWGSEIEAIGAACGCRDADLAILGLLLAPDVDPEVRIALRRATGDAARRGMDLDLLRGIIDPLNHHAAALLDALDIDAPLRRHALVELMAASDGRQILTAAPRLVRFVVDLPVRTVEEGLRHALHLAVADPDEPGFAELCAPALDAAARLGLDHHWMLVGPEGLGQEQGAVKLARTVSRRVLVARLPVLLSGGRSAVDAIRLVLREARLCQALPFFVGVDVLFEDRVVHASDRATALHRLELEPGPVFLLAARTVSHLASWLREHGEPEPIQFSALSVEQRQMLWQRQCPQATADDIEYVAHAFALTPAAIRRASHSAVHRAAAEIGAAPGVTIVPSRLHLEAACRDETTHHLQHLSTRVTVRVDWSEVVLDEDTLSTIQEILATARHRKLVHETWGFRRHLPAGTGLSVMFSGEPGTGKTLVAGLVARDLGVELYKVDLSQIVSKYIGETEKQLGDVFDEAQQAHVALLFDEADSLFGKRTEVKSSVDRYANLEVNFLLQKMEEFEGITFLTTNFKRAIDEAFLRRIRFRVHFPSPEADERERLWKVLLPKAAVLAEPLSFDLLARDYVMSGGHIRNAVVRAAFLAAAANSPIGQSHLERGAALEYREMGKLQIE